MRSSRSFARLVLVVAAAGWAAGWSPGWTPGEPAGWSLGWAAPAGALAAQQVERERQEPVLPGTGITEIDPELRARLGLFPDVEGFRAARLLVRGDGTIVLEVESVREGRIERERHLLDPAGLTAWRSDLQARLADAAARPLAGQQGRGGLVLGQTLLGLAYHGWAVPVALDVESARMGVAAYLLTAGTSFAAPYFLTRDRPVTESHRDLALYGSTRGIGAGLLLGDALTARDAGSRDRVRLAGGVLGGAAGAAVGYAAAEALQPDAGTVALWGAMGDLGLAAGAGLAYVAGPYASETVERIGDGFTWEETRARNPRLGHAVTLAGGVAGLAAGAWLGERRRFTEGNVWVLRSAAVLGAQVGLTGARIATEEGRPLATAAVAGGLGGTALGVRWLDARRFTEGEGLLVAAGHLAGGATALGLTYLAIENIDENELTYLATGTLGSLAGAFFVARALDPGTALPESFGPGGGSGRGGAEGVPGRYSLEVAPAGLLFSLTDRSEPAPILTLRF